MTNILISGISGFTGSHLSELLIKDETNKIFGTIRGRCRQTNFIDNIKENLILLECDLTDYNSIQTTLEESEPEVIYHLGAQSFVPTSWRAPQETFNTNVMGTLNLLEAIRKSKHNPKILITGSSEQYGLVNIDELPVKETNALKPMSPYAVSKITQDMLGYQYFQSYGLKIIRTRAFNLIGPRSGQKIFTANFAIQIAEIEKRKNEPIIEVGNLEAIRDLVDVRDVVRAYSLAISKCDYGEVYNISTCIGWKVGIILDMMLSLSKEKIEVRQDKNRLRPSDVPILIGDSTKFRDKTGWEPQIKISKSLQDVLSYWRENL